MQAAGLIDQAGLMEAIYERCERPRFAFQVLSLIAEQADAFGEAGPEGPGGEPLREWLASRMALLPVRDRRRHNLARRVASEIAAELPSDPGEAEQALGRAILDQATKTALTNISRVVSSLCDGGFLSRYYAGHTTDHSNRGGQRHAVYVVAPFVMHALGRGVPLPRRPKRRPPPVAAVSQMQLL